MRPRSLVLVAALAITPLVAASPARCQDAPAAEGSGASAQTQPPMEFDTYQLVLLKRPAEPMEYPEEKLQEIQAAHLGHLTRMAREGHLVVAGPFGDQQDERLRGLALYRVGSVEEARRLAEADPAVQAGRLEVEVMTWYTQKGALAFPVFEDSRAADEGPASLQRLGAFAEDRDVLGVGEDAVAAAAGELAGDAEVDQEVMAEEAAGKERPVWSRTRWMDVRGRALRASWTRRAEAARRPWGAIRSWSVSNKVSSRRAVATAPSALCRTPSRKNASQASQSPVVRMLPRRR